MLYQNDNEQEMFSAIFKLLQKKDLIYFIYSK